MPIDIVITDAGHDIQFTLCEFPVEVVLGIETQLVDERNIRIRPCTITGFSIADISVRRVIVVID